MKKIAYLYGLLAFAYKKNPIFFCYPLIALLSVATELIAMMTLLPLFSIVTKIPIQGKDPIVALLHSMQIMPTAKTLIMLFCVLFISRTFINLIAQNISLKYGKKLLAQLGSATFGNILLYRKLDAARDKSMGHYMHLAEDEALNASMLVIEFHQLFASLAMVGLYFLLIAWYSIPVAVMMMLFLSFAFFIMGTVFKKIQKLAQQQIAESQSATSIFSDGLNGLRSIRSLLAEQFVISAYSDRIKTYTHTLYEIDSAHLLVKGLPMMVLFALLLPVSALGVFDNPKTVNFAVVLSAMFLVRFFPALGQILNGCLRLTSDKKAAQEVIEMAASKSVKSVPGELLHHSIKTVRLVDVYYAYPGNTPIFEQLTLTFSAQRSYAITGAPGSGKSTLLNILMLLTYCQRGEIWINEKRHRSYDVHSVRKKIMLLEQERILFNDTVINNITLGEDYSPIQIAEACKIACINVFINDLPGGYNFVLSDRGQNISPSQRQRIAIARMVLREPEILLLDEVTTALDDVTKYQVVKNLLEAFEDKIIIFVTHDPFVMNSVDHVFNIEDKKASLREKSIQMGQSQTTLP